MVGRGEDALAEAEVEYEDYVSDQVWVKFPLRRPASTSVASRACGGIDPHMDHHSVDYPRQSRVSFSPRIEYGLYQTVDAPTGNWANPGDLFVIADKLAVDIFRQARVTAFKRLETVDAEALGRLSCQHPLKILRGRLRHSRFLCSRAIMSAMMQAPGLCTQPRDTAGTTSTSGRRTPPRLAARGISTAIPYTVDEDGRFTEQAPGFTGKRVLTENGDKGDANEAVIKALIDAGMLIARGRLKHQYPHSWRSKKPVIFRNTPQWFIAMDKSIADGRGQAMPGDTLRQRALAAIRRTRWVPPQGENRITGMIESRPDWVISRQRAWGVPITVFVREQRDGGVDILR